MIEICINPRQVRLSIYTPRGNSKTVMTPAASISSQLSLGWNGARFEPRSVAEILRQAR